MPLGKPSNVGVFAAHVSHGSLFLSKIEDIDREPRLLPYAHYLRQAWSRLDLSGVLCVDGRPTVYLCEGKRFTTAQKRERQRFVWNQGLVPLLILLTPQKVEVHSGVSKPSPKDGHEDSPEHSLIPNLDRIT